MKVFTMLLILQPLGSAIGWATISRLGNDLQVGQGSSGWARISIPSLRSQLQNTTQNTNHNHLQRHSVVHHNHNLLNISHTLPHNHAMHIGTSSERFNTTINMKLETASSDFVSNLNLERSDSNKPGNWDQERYPSYATADTEPDRYDTNIISKRIELINPSHRNIKRNYLNIAVDPSDSTTKRNTERSNWNTVGNLSATSKRYSVRNLSDTPLKRNRARNHWDTVSTSKKSRIRNHWNDAKNPSADTSKKTTARNHLDNTGGRLASTSKKNTARNHWSNAGIPLLIASKKSTATNVWMTSGELSGLHTKRDTRTNPKRYAYHSVDYDAPEHSNMPPFVDQLPPGPFFDLDRSANVTALVGGPAQLNCRVNQIGNRTVSWLRHRDLHLLTVGRYTYTSDQRFRAEHVAGSEDWPLMVKFVQVRDSGLYECQVSTTPPMRHYIWLRVVEPRTVVLGGPDVYINTGSSINLTCLVDYTPRPPAYIIWKHNDKVISYDSDRGGVSVVTEKGPQTSTNLLVRNASPQDSGTYTCSPSSAPSSPITVHVLRGEHPAAMQHGGHSPQQLSWVLGAWAVAIFLVIK